MFVSNLFEFEKKNINLYKYAAWKLITTTTKIICKQKKTKSVAIILRSTLSKRIEDVRCWMRKTLADLECLKWGTVFWVNRNRSGLKLFGNMCDIFLHPINMFLCGFYASFFSSTSPYSSFSSFPRFIVFLTF
jgi:hypothetical protein